MVLLLSKYYNQPYAASLHKSFNDNYDQVFLVDSDYHHKCLRVKRESGVMLSLSLSRLGPVPSKLFCSVCILRCKFPSGLGPAAQIARI